MFIIIINFFILYIYIAWRRLRRYEEPLVLVLLWGGRNSDLKLSLQETEDHHDFRWDDFSRVELENFTRVLDDEETEHIDQV